MRFKYLLIPLILLLAANSFATEKDIFGSGVFVGDTDGITGKYKLNDRHAPDVSFGLEAAGDNGHQIYGDYFFYKLDFLKVSEGKQPLYFGGGAQNITDSIADAKNTGDKFSLRFPVGNDFLFWKSSLDAFFELAPVLSSTPDMKFQFGGGIDIKLLF